MLDILIEHQTALNNSIDPDWQENITVSQFALAASQEVSELIDHLPWKWWKAGKPDMKQVHFEVVDIFHFLLSIGILLDETEHIDGLSKVTTASGIKHSGFRTMLRTCRQFQYHLNKTEIDFQDLVIEFRILMYETGLDWKMLTRLYFAKNILNQFRQDHGYNHGTYIKTWLGQEDNIILYDIVKTHGENIYERLESVYRDVLNDNR